MTEHLSGSQILCRALLEQGVDVVFGYPCGAIMPSRNSPSGATSSFAMNRRRRTPLMGTPERAEERVSVWQRRARERPTS
jgi:hypothetical protein